MHKRYKSRPLAGLCPAFLVAATALCLASCTEQVSGRAGMLAGAFAWHNQDWNKATLSFLPLSDSPNNDIADYAAYGLALSYIEQNELKAAQARLSAIEGASSEKLRSAVWYEKGICEYLAGNYSDAALCFRRSLEIEPSRADAKINLELSLLQADGASANAGAFSPVQLPASESGESAAENAAYSLIERKEIEQWKKLAEAVKETPAPDY